jgi:hypothetical protein
MDKSIKKYLTKIIKESYTSDVDEMAFDKKGVREPSKDTRTGLPIPPKMASYAKDPENPEYVLNKKGEEEFMPDYHVDNKKLKKVKDPNDKKGGSYVVDRGEQLAIVPTGCQDAESFAEQNKSWLDTLEQKHGPITIVFVGCERTSFAPRNMKAGTSYVPSGIKQSEGETNQRKFNGILRRTIFGEGFNEVLNKKSIPSIKIDRENKDMHEGTYTNEKIVFRTHNNNSYQSSVDFLKAVVARFKGKEGPEMKTYAMARQYNTGNAKWNADRKMDVTYQGKTDKYGLDKRGYEETNLDVTVRMDLEILGEKMGDSFSWNVRMKVNLGKKLTEDRRMKGSFNSVKLTQTTKTAQLEPGKEFNENNIIMNDLNVVNALIEAIDELKSEINGITQKELLPLANVTYKQTTSMQEPNLNESKERLIRRIVKQIKS